MESYEKIKKVLALGFMNFLDENKPKDKMCLSNGECADIEKAFNEKDWPKLARYLDKYTESEDERIRKAIVNLMEVASEAYLIEATGFKKEKFLSYLEKQKEQKPAEWSEEDEKMRYFVTEAVQSRYSDRELAKYLDPKIIKEKKQLKQRLFDWLRDLRPSWKPSEIHKTALLMVIRDPNNAGSESCQLALRDLLEQLKKL